MTQVPAPSPCSAAQSCDVLVIRGGPTGSTIAGLLAQQGRDVVVLEKAHHPLFHTGESLLQADILLFERLGRRDEVERIGMPKWGVGFVSPQHPHRAFVEFGDAWEDGGATVPATLDDGAARTSVFFSGACLAMANAFAGAEVVSSALNQARRAAVAPSLRRHPGRARDGFVLKPSSLRRVCAALTALTALTALSAQAADLPLWEAGVGAGALHVPHYRGSEQSHDWLLPVPYFVYRGTIFKSDRDGTRAVLLDTQRVDVDVSLNASPPAGKNDNRARAGMANLSATLEVGPNVNWHLGKGQFEGGGWKLDLRVPLRAVFTVESHPQALGWSSTPVLNLDLDLQGWNIGLQGGPLLGTRRLHGYFYDVAPAYASATRPAYAAPGGYAGWGLTTSASRRIGNWWLAAFARSDSVAGAAFEASPLVKQRHTVTYGFVASWVFKVSETRVAAQR